MPFNFSFTKSAILDLARDPGSYFQRDNPGRANRNFTPFDVLSQNTGATSATGPVTFTANGNLDNKHSYVEVDATSGNVTLTLPKANNYRVGFQTFVINRIDGSANTVTIQRDGTNDSAATINGATSVTHPGRWKLLTVMLVKNGGNDAGGVWRAWASA